MCIADDPDRITATLYPAGQQRVICQNGSDSHHNAAESVPLPLNMIPGNFPGDPFGSACVCGDFSVHRHGVFHGNEGAFCGDIVEEHLVQRIAFLLQNIFGHIYAVCAQDCNSFSGYQRIRVSGTHDHPVNARVQNRIHAGRLLSVMAARLQCHIQGRSLRIFGAGCQRIALRMSLTVSLVPALSDDPALFYDHGTHHRVGRRPSATLFCKLQSQTHILFVVHRVASKRKSPEQKRSGQAEKTQGTLVQKRKLQNANASQSSLHKHRTVQALRLVSSFIQTVLSASEFHRIMPYGSWAVPPVGNHTLP